MAPNLLLFRIEEPITFMNMTNFLIALFVIVSFGPLLVGTIVAGLSILAMLPYSALGLAGFLATSTEEKRDMRTIGTHQSETPAKVLALKTGHPEENLRRAG
jgi:hypothetical protein